jgi:hypothetical protein
MDYIELGWMKLFNADPEGIGLSCLLSFLSNPVARLVVTICIPFGAVCFFSIGIVLADLLWRLVYRSRRNLNEHAESNQEEESDNEPGGSLTTDQTDQTPLLLHHSLKSENDFLPKNHTQHPTDDASNRFRIGRSFLVQPSPSSNSSISVPLWPSLSTFSVKSRHVQA